MTAAVLEGFEKPRLRALLEHFAAIEDPREPWRVAHPLPEVLLLVVCRTICDCDDCDLIADRGAAHLDVSSRTGLKDKSRFDTRYCISSAQITAEGAASPCCRVWSPASQSEPR